MAEVDEPANFALTGVFFREWCSAAVTVSGEAAGCEAKAPADVVPKFLCWQFCIVHEARHDCKLSSVLAHKIHLLFSTLIHPLFEFGEFSQFIGFLALLLSLLAVGCMPLMVPYVKGYDCQ